MYDNTLSNIIIVISIDVVFSLQISILGSLKTCTCFLSLQHNTISPSNQLLGTQLNKYRSPCLWFRMAHLHLSVSELNSKGCLLVNNQP